MCIKKMKRKYISTRLFFFWLILDPAGIATIEPSQNIANIFLTNKQIYQYYCWHVQHGICFLKCLKSEYLYQILLFNSNISQLPEAIRP